MWPKLESLERLRNVRGDAFRTLPFEAFSTDDWKASPQQILDHLLAANLGSLVVVRSCAAQEDAMLREPPGFFASILDVVCEPNALRQAIDEVLVSYGRRSDPVQQPDKIIVQRQLTSVRLCGVMHIGPEPDGYVAVDFDDCGGSTDAVTSGRRTRRAMLSVRQERMPALWRELRRCAGELRRHFLPPIFVEFAFDNDLAPVIFQVRRDRRPVAQFVSGTSAAIRATLAEADRVVAECGPLSVMTDWNPAEILGPRPLPLDTSLYDAIMMHGSWAEGRISIGWNAPDSFKLTTTLCGRPYVKIQESLRSLLPSLPRALCDRLVDDRLQLLLGAPDLHDKVEFRVMWSAFAFDCSKTASELHSRGFADADVNALFDGLRGLTKRAIDDGPRMLLDDLAGTSKIAVGRKQLMEKQTLQSPRRASSRIREALAICRRFGATPFSRQARLAFTFRYVITHLSETGCLSAADLGRWQAGLNTLTRRLSIDAGRVASGALSEKTFLDHYGHLRPHSYDLESLRYDERPLPNVGGSAHSLPLSWTPAPCQRLREILHDTDCVSDEASFWRAAAGAYRGREELKFSFSALLSDVLTTLARVAELAQVSRRNMRRQSLDQILGAMECAPDWRAFGETLNGSSAVVQNDGPDLVLPDVILLPGDLDVVIEPSARPTFIGTRRVDAPAVRVDSADLADNLDVRGKIVLLETADPGFDWLFALSPAALITAYGGEFSHMGIRCSEFDVSAAIGCGYESFELFAAALELSLDPVSGAIYADGRKVVSR